MTKMAIESMFLLGLCAICGIMFFLVALLGFFDSGSFWGVAGAISGFVVCVCIYLLSVKTLAYGKENEKGERSV